MGSSPLAVTAPVAYVESLFVQQRLPYELGWQPSLVPITFASLGAYIVEIFSEIPEQLPIGLEVLTEGTYRQFVADTLAVLQKTKAVTGS